MEQNLQDISDGRLYEWNDMAKVGCHDCTGCSACCRDMGQSILLDPHDVFHLSSNLGKAFEELLQGPVELHAEEGLILPNLRMAADGACSFLDSNGRCSIHAFRPGICRLFPLGRNYTPEHLNYFLLLDACPVKNKTKMKVGKWLDCDNRKVYQQFLLDWHNLTKQVRAQVTGCLDAPEMSRKITMAFLQLFYIKPYNKADFYTEFYERVKQISE
ncbi:MAG: YkgJ family cysteine cluster protein [Agathobacter sp.]|nr:YkgJ family cysteine cluster protein [Agathobacter sp.]